MRFSLYEFTEEILDIRTGDPEDFGPLDSDNITAYLHEGKLYVVSPEDGGVVVDRKDLP